MASRSTRSKRNREIGDEGGPILSEKKRPKLDSKSTLKELTHDAYTVGWVCALPKELTAAKAVLDETHARLPKPPNDNNTYTLGAIGKHNVVVACLPLGKIGTNPAATVVTHMVNTFPSIKFGLMVGIGGGIPPEVRLGDVVVSTPVSEYPGVVQWDIGKAEMGGTFKRIGTLNNPPNSLLTALADLKSHHEMYEPRMNTYLEELKQKFPKLVPKYLRSNSLEDVLFRADYDHGDEGGENCQFCDKTKIVQREPREMCVHYGLIASGNQVIKDATVRQRLNNDLGGQVLCVEMEAAGIMHSFPGIVIRGICDYADSHKSYAWQEHAAAVAAAFGKELLDYVDPSDVERERTVRDVLKQVGQIVTKTGADVAHMKSTMDKDENLKILNWLTPIDYGPQQSDFIKRRHEGTGTWLLQTNEFNTWLNQRNLTLFCSGIPGAGKTILTSIVVDHLFSKFEADPDVGIACLYINFQRQQQQKPEDLLLSILKQWLQRRTSMPDNIRVLYDLHEPRRTRLSLAEIVKALEAVATLHSRAIIVVDALDECDESDDNREKFLSTILNVQKQTTANLFVTSRPNDEIAKFFDTALSLEIRANDDDVESYVNGQMPLLQADILDDDLRNRIRRDVVSSVDGMFLLAQLHMNNLKEQPTKGHIKQVLVHLDKGVDGLYKTYDQAMERINEQGSHSQKIAKSTLGWIVHAQWPLSTEELRHALAVRPDMTELDKDYLPSIQLIQSKCAGLVTTDEQSGTIRLVHYTTQEYFEKNWTAWFPGAHADITTVCVTYLSFDIFSTGSCQSDQDFEERLQTHALYTYAAKNWGYHASRSEIENDGILKLLRSRDKSSAASQAMMAADIFLVDFENVLQHTTGVHLAAYFGLEWVMTYLLHNGLDLNDIDSKDGYGGTPLARAAQNGHKAVVKLLLDTGKVDVNSRNNDGDTPLAEAAWNGNKAVVKLLLDTGKVDVNSRNNDGDTPLAEAAWNGNKAVVKLLLNTGKVEINSRNNSGYTPLARAAWNGHKAVVKLLLDTGKVDINSRDENGDTLLSEAVWEGNEAVVKLLLDTGKIDVNSRDNDGYTPLVWAVQGGNEAVVKLLLDTSKVNINSRDNDGNTLLLDTVSGGNEAVVKLLLDTGKVDVNSRDNDGYTPLLWAAWDGHEVVVKLLLDTGKVDVNLQDNDGDTPLARAVWRGHEAVVKLLQSYGAIS